MSPFHLVIKTQYLQISSVLSDRSSYGATKEYIEHISCFMLPAYFSKFSAKLFLDATNEYCYNLRQ